MTRHWLCLVAVARGIEVACTAASDLATLFVRSSVSCRTEGQPSSLPLNRLQFLCLRLRISSSYKPKEVPSSGGVPIGAVHSREGSETKVTKSVSEAHGLPADVEMSTDVSRDFGLHVDMCCHRASLSLSCMEGAWPNADNQVLSDGRKRRSHQMVRRQAARPARPRTRPLLPMQGRKPK